MGARSGAAGLAEVPAGWRPPGTPLCTSLTALLRRHWVLLHLCSSLPSDCREANEEALVMAITQVTAGEAGARPGPVGQGKAAGVTDREPAKGVDGGGYGGGVWHRGQSQSRW